MHNHDNIMIWFVDSTRWPVDQSAHSFFWFALLLFSETMEHIRQFSCFGMDTYSCPSVEGPWGLSILKTCVDENHAQVVRPVTTSEYLKGDCILRRQMECEGCKKLKEKLQSLEKDVESLIKKETYYDFLVVAGEFISHVYDDDVLCSLIRIKDPVVEGVKCWDDVAKRLRPLRYRANYKDDEVCNAECLQDMIYEVVWDLFRLSREHWNAIRQLKNSRNDEIHSSMEDEMLLDKVDDLTEKVEDLSETTREALQAIIACKRRTKRQ
jgi:hypothetical protein